MKKTTMLRWVVPALMIAFFVRNIYLVETANMDSWMGGGMRMFARVDKMLYRVSGFEVSHDDHTHFVNLRNVPQLQQYDVESRLLPSDERLSDILASVKKMNWCYSAENDSIILSKECVSPVPKNAILAMKTFRTDFDHESNQINLKLINDAKE